MLRKTFENRGRDFLYGDTKLVAAMEGIGKFFFFFQSVQASRERGLYECFRKTELLPEINSDKR